MSGEIVVRRVAANDPCVVPVIATHVAAMDADEAPAEATHRLDLAELLHPSISFFAAFDTSTTAVLGIGALGIGALGIGALATYDGWGEVKSMHVLAAARGRGISRLILSALEAEARDRALPVLRLETGRSFAAAIGLYRSAGFVERAAFGHYPDHPMSYFMEKQLS